MSKGSSRSHRILQIGIEILLAMGDQLDNGEGCRSWKVLSFSYYVVWSDKLNCAEVNPEIAMAHPGNTLIVPQFFLNSSNFLKFLIGRSDSQLSPYVILTSSDRILDLRLISIGLGKVI